MRHLLTVVALCLLSVDALAAPLLTVAYPLTNAPTPQHYVVDQNGVPFFVNGDSPWFLCQSLSSADVEYYLSNRWVQGYNSIILDITARAADSLNADDRNFFGKLPFTNTIAGPYTNLLSWDVAYFTNVDAIIQRAGAYGMNVFAYPLYDDFAGAGYYANALVGAPSNSIWMYGNFIGSRYMGISNIVWIGAGDYTEPGTPSTALWNIMAKGIRSADTNHMITAQAARNSPASIYSAFVTNYNATYPSYFTYIESLADYQISPVLPSFDREPYYLGRTGLTTFGGHTPPSNAMGQLDTRAFFWWSVLSGDAGCFYGDDTPNEGWQFGANWKAHLWDAASTSITNVYWLLQNYPWYNLIPDSNHVAVTAGFGTFGQTNYVTCSREATGKFLFAYSMGAAPTLTVDMTKAQGWGMLANANWYNPRTGAKTFIGQFAATGTHNFTPPDNNDWVLAIDSTNQNWFVDNSLTNSANTGTNWANAFTNFSSMKFNIFSSPHFQQGDTIWISGGPVGGTQVYYGNLDDAGGSSTGAGTALNPITIRRASTNDLAHGGRVKLEGGRIQLSQNFWVVDGAINDSLSPINVFDTTNAWFKANCGIWVHATNTAVNAVLALGTGTKLMWLEVSEWGGDNSAVILQDNGPSTAVGNGSEIRNCYIHDGNGYGIQCLVNNVITNWWGQLNVHHNYLTNCHDNFMQINANVDYHDNFHIYQGFPPRAHPDCIQEINSYACAWNNVFVDNQGSYWYVEAGSILNHDVIGFNNLYYSHIGFYFPTNWSGNNNTPNNPGTGFDLTGHDAGGSNECDLLNFYYWGQTMFNQGTSFPSQRAAFLWASGNSTGPNPQYRNPATEWVTNFNIFGNNIIGVSPYNTFTPINLSTNLDYFNGFNGWTYTEDQVRFDFNSINGYSGNGNGATIYYKGSHTAGAPIYTNMAHLASETRYKSNNNGTAVYADINNFDFRPRPGDSALVGKGTNLLALMATVRTDITNVMARDILGNPRPTGAWTIGAFEPPSGLWVDITNGNDSTGSGTFSAPWKTIQKGANTATSGQIVNIVAGQYDEDDVTTTAGVTFRGYPANDPNQPVLTHTWSIKHTNTTLEGLTFHQWANASSAVYCYPPSVSNNGSQLTVTNCTFKDGKGIISSNAYFFASATMGSNYIYCASFISGGDFRQFNPGDPVYLGSYSLAFYTNCGGNSPIDNSFYHVDHASPDGHYLYLTNLFQNDPGTNYFAWIVLGNSGPKNQFCLEVPVGSSIAASNITFINNLVTNTWGCQIDIGPSQGTNLIFGNHFTQFHGQYLANPNASNMGWWYNLIDFNKNIFHWGYGELGNPAIHPSGGRFYDNQCSLFQSAQDGQTNCAFVGNVVRDCDNEGLEIDWGPSQTGWLIQNNIFYAIPMPGALNGNGVLEYSNLFVRCGYDEGTLAWTATGGTVPNPMTNCAIVGNVSVNVGGHLNVSQESLFGTLTNTYVGFNVSNNVSITAETMGYGKTAGDNVLLLAGGGSGTGMLTNNGDPLFINLYNPVDPNYSWVPGQDPRIQFVGFKYLPTSYLANLGLLSWLQLQTNSGTIAHYKIKLASFGWKDLTITNFNPSWEALPAWLRPDVIRPVAIPEAVGSNSVSVTWDASASLDDSGAVNTGITNYHWACSDGFTLDTNNPVMVHVLNTVGTNTMTLTTTTTNAISSVYTSQYRVLLDINITQQPQNQSVTVGQTATFTVSATASSTISYQWQVSANGGATWNNTGGNSSTLNVANCQLSDSGKLYRVILTDSAGSLTSVDAILTVSGGSDPSISVQPQNQSVFVTQTATFSVTASGGSTLHYAWTFNGGSVGTDSPTYSRVNCLLGDNGGIVQVTVSDLAGSVLSSTAVLSVNPDPVITLNPQNQTVVAGNNATFSVTATGQSTLSYQWTFNGVNVGLNQNSYTRSNCQLADNGGVMQVTVTDTAGSLPSSTATLTVLPVSPFSWTIGGSTMGVFSK